MNESNLLKVFEDIKNGNNLGEKITLVGATKFVDVQNVNKAISLGLKDIAENKPQEFKEKFPQVLPCNYHFIGYLQCNKVKYLIGKACLIQSCDRNEILLEISKQSLKNNVTTNVLIEVNNGVEEEKHGYKFFEVENACKYASTLPNIRLQGLMSMLPNTDNEAVLANTTKKLRTLYDGLKNEYGFKYLSVGMSNDYKTAIKNGSNMIRVGSYIFGERN